MAVEDQVAVMLPLWVACAAWHCKILLRERCSRVFLAGREHKTLPGFQEGLSRALQK